MKQQPTQALLMQAVALHQQGKLDQANALYEKVLAKQPRNFDALHLGGVLEYQRQNFELALDRIEKAIAVDSKQTAAHNHLALVLQSLGRWDAALASIDKVIALEPNFENAHYNRGNVLQALMRWDEAVVSYGVAIAQNPSHADACITQGNAYKKLYRFDLALESYQQAIRIRPDYAEAHSNCGTALVELNRFDEALVSYQNAITLKPDYTHAFVNYGQALETLNRWTESLASYEQAVALQPDYTEAIVKRGIVLRKMGNLDGALTCFNQALAINPRFADAHNERGVVLKKLGRLKEAFESYSQAVRIEPEHEETYCNLGGFFQELERWEEAAACYARALEIKSDDRFLLGALFNMRCHLCHWSDWDQDFKNLKNGLQNGQKISPPFGALALLDDLALQRASSETWTKTYHAGLSPIEPLVPHTHPRKIRPAYYSADFHNHATAYLMAQLFECHDRERFELFAFSFGPDSSDPMRQRLVSAFDHFIDVRHETDQAVAQRSRDLGIDIAVDLKGYTQGQRAGIFAHRCAPVQVNYLGYPGTMGAPFMDYLIADKVVIPPESQEHYSEKIAYLPHSYQVNDSHREIAQTVWRKADLGLPEEGFVFCCFNNTYKITPNTFASWMRILQAVPGSVLWLLGDNETAQRNLRQYAQEAGVEPERLVFAPRMPLPEHLARHRAADLFLDTLPCNAHTTASDALWAGLPVLTQQGQAFAARVSRIAVMEPGMCGVMEPVFGA